MKGHYGLSHISVVDLLDPAVKRYGQAIIDNACYKFVMGCDGKNLEEAAKIFNLSEQEVNMLQEKNRSQGFLREIPDYVYEWMFRMSSFR